MKTALITGASGQDAYYLSKLLLNRGYKVVATQRRCARPPANTVKELLQYKNYSILEADITDLGSVIRAIRNCSPDEFYHLAAQSEVGTSWGQAIATSEITGLGTLVCLEAIREYKPDTKFYFAGSSEQYGDAHDGKPTNESSLFAPRSPYACAKLFGYHMSRTYRYSHDMFVSCGILFNHESPHRKPYFVTRKITQGVANIIAGNQKTIELGNIDSGRDWGHAADYMEAAWLMLQHKTSDDYVVATGQFHTIRDLLDVAFNAVGINDWFSYVTADTVQNVRPHDVTRLIGDSTKIYGRLGWKPRYSFDELIKEMVSYDLDRIGAKKLANL
jgi:GDPmannose 4,6-dehydratase